MRYLNQLEPDALVARFAEHPPIDFRVLQVAGTPAFVAPFDLLTTADDDARKKVMGAPGYGWWGRLLRWRTAFVGTTVSEYALFPRDAQPDALARALRDQLGKRQRLMIVKDIPQASPLCDAANGDWCRRFADACAAAGFVLLEGQALAYVTIDFQNEDEYLARLSSGRRKDIRRKLRKRDEVAVEAVRCGDALFDDEAVIDAYYALYENVYAQSEIHFDKLSRDFFAAVLRDAANGGVVFVYRHQGGMIGWNLCFVVDGKLIDKYVGFAYPQAREQNLYFTSWFHNLAFAREHGLTHYVAGWTDPQVKSYLGAQFTLTRHAIYLRNPLLRAAARNRANSSRATANGQRMNKREPLILDFDGSIGAIPGATTIALADWQEAIRFGCTLRTFNRLRTYLDEQLPASYGTVLMGSGDYHHLTWPLVQRQRARGPFQLVVFDNHPDNMRFPWGIHCGSWVRRVAMLPFVTHVHVVGITSGDIGAKHAWENYLRPLQAGKLTYWCMDVNVDWAAKLGLSDAFRRFDDPDALTCAFVQQLKQAPQPTYLSIDKDAFSVDTARTNWDQGRLEEPHAMAIIEALRGRIVASDINGEVSAYQYRTWWKRLLSGMDGQEPVPQSELDAWQAQQRAFNTRLLAAIAESSV